MTMKKIVIIGGMAAGCKAGARLRRIMPDSEIKIIEKKSFLSYGTCGMPLYASGDIDGFLDLAKTPWGTVRDENFFEDVHGITTLTNTEALSILPDNKSVLCKNIQSGEEISIGYDALIISAGAKPIPPPFRVQESEKISYFHNPLDAKKFRSLAQTGKVGSAAIIGCGLIGCELAEALVSLWGIETHVIEKENRLLPGILDEELSGILERIFKDNDIDVKLEETVESVKLSDEGNPVVFLNSGETIESDYVFLCLGVKPENQLASASGINIGASGGIIVDSQMRTNIPGIWAAGDCIESTDSITGEGRIYPLGSLANRQGRVAADSIAGRSVEFKTPIGVASMKVFGLTTASVGMTEHSAAKAGFNAGIVCGTWFDRPDYHPDSHTIFGKMIYDKRNLKLLGLQLAGKGEVTRYIDSFTVYLRNNATANDLLDFEHVYTPPHSGPMNPLNYLGAMAINQESDGIIQISPTNAAGFTGTILDLREPEEINAYPYTDSAINIPISKLRSRHGELDKNSPILTICSKGLRSYQAARFLKNEGFADVIYLGGGAELAQAIIGPD
ncbi:MAG: hypothetical protein QG635_208 [Bacteroidota bacterium]|nr:hypothetical protein [Bacteroidota bacterium]